MTTTSTPTLEPDWLPENQRLCLGATDYWKWDYGIGEDNRTVLGGPSQTTDCVPTSWDSQLTYAATQCPPRYTAACQDANSPGAVTCCPTVYAFSCEDPLVMKTKPHASLFRCLSEYGNSDSDIMVMRRTVLGTGTASATSGGLFTATLRQQPGLHLFAIPLIYATPTSTSASPGTSSSSTTSSSPTASASSSSQLSAGAAAGIGVGAAAAFFLLAAFGVFYYRRWRKLRAQVPPPANYPVQYYAGSVAGPPAVEKEGTPGPTRTALSSPAAAPLELPGQPPVELGDNQRHRP